ncbi:DUF6541 family protein [Arthrobacter sp. Soil764]|uniref:DUF6541 family protein n=1 Tax=Arthrobacter sp. Soil764 TaxID=1736403 RepID=UPI0012E3308A|nr:DUF6541 family protein [Arthrobacter sp. Soil764]
MEWLSASAAALAALAVIFLPGLVMGWTWKVRGLGLLVAAPLLSVSVVAVSAVALGLCGIPWGGPQFFGSALIACVIVSVARVLVPSGALQVQGNWPRYSTAGIGLGALLVAATLVAAWGHPGAFSQTIDDVFHLNALTWIKETGSASSLTLGQLNGSAFYPAAWHGVVSLTMALSGQAAPIAIFAVSAVIATAIWVPGCIYLCRHLLGASGLLPVVSGVASGAFAAFPLLLLDFGVLYPNHLAVAMLPGALGLMVQLLRVSAVPDLVPSSAALLLCLGLPGLALAHPSALHSLVAFTWPVFLVFLWRKWFDAAGLRGRGYLVVGAGAAMAFTLVLWRFVRPDPSSYWNPVEMRAQAIGEAIMVAPLGQASTPIIAVFMLMGLFYLIRTPERRWVAGLFAVGAYLFVNVASIDALPFRRTVAGPWYADPYRLAALLPLAAVPVVSWAIVALTSRLQPLLAWKGRRFRSASVAVLLVLVFLIGQASNILHQVYSAQDKYSLTEASPLLSRDEKELLDELPSLVPDGEVLAGNPWTGTALAYTFGARKTLQLHMLSATPADVDIVNRKLDDARWDPRVCGAVNRLGLRYVLDFGKEEIGGGSHPYDGLLGLDTKGVAEVVRQSGGARLLRVTACADS